jgi:hypothetical protein
MMTRSHLGAGLTQKDALLHPSSDVDDGPALLPALGRRTPMLIADNQETKRCRVFLLSAEY